MSKPLASLQAIYQQDMRRYDDPSELLGFFYREVEVRKRRAYEDTWHEARARAFPSGLFNTPLTAQKRSAGVHVAEDSESARKAGLGAGDIIVAVDGWHVANLPQYYAARAFAESGPLTLTVWRGNLAEIRIANRMMRPVFQVENYPVQGWIER